ncbi:MAG TPA: hypothetical protein VGS16_00645 [Candidatus Dormibacteraeota bacterium]|nr:hypothetical protein [Candidatus Dormibacteraeota bacterium]
MSFNSRSCRCRTGRHTPRSIERTPRFGKEAAILGRRSRYSWRRWEALIEVDRSCCFTIKARATDEAGRTQPEKSEWNRLGYGNNAVHEIAISAGGPGALR